MDEMEFTEAESNMNDLLILAHQIVHVAFSFGELHFIHSFPCVPMQESFPAEHCCELLRDPLEDFLNSSGVANKGCSHWKATRRDVADSHLDIVWNPLNKVGRILVLHRQHLFINFFH